MEINYYVNKEKKVVVCTLQPENLENPCKFVGKAKCSPEDEFNETVGKRIAYLRAYVKMKESIVRYKKDYCRNLMSFINNILAPKINKISTTIQRNKKEISLALREIKSYL